jgi:hypothetical protein
MWQVQLYHHFNWLLENRHWPTTSNQIVQMCPIKQTAQYLYFAFPLFDHIRPFSQARNCLLQPSYYEDNRWNRNAKICLIFSSKTIKVIHHVVLLVQSNVLVKCTLSKCTICIHTGQTKVSAVSTFKCSINSLQVIFYYQMIEYKILW